MVRAVPALAVLIHLTGAVAAGPLLVRYADDQLSVHADRVPLRQVLDAVAAESGMELSGDVGGSSDVTIDLDRVTLPDALRRLLGEQSFVLRYDGDRPRRLELGKAATVDVPGPAAVAPPSIPDKPAPVVAADVVVPVRGDLARRLGVQSMSLRDLMTVATSHQDPGVRRRAMRKTMHLISDDPVARGLLFAPMRDLDVHELAKLGLSGGRGDAEQLIRSAISGLSDPALRLRAREVLRELQSAPAPGDG